MAQMNTGVSEANASEGACQVHARPCFQIVRVSDSPLQIFGNDAQCMDCPDVTDWVATLVCWSLDGIGRAGAPHAVGNGGV